MGRSPRDTIHLVNCDHMKGASMLTLMLLDVREYIGWNGCEFMSVVEFQWGWVSMYETTKTNQNEFFRGWILIHRLNY